MYMRIYISNFENGNKTRRQKRKQNKTKIIIIINKRTTEEKILSVENLTGYDDIVCDFALGTFNLLDRIASFSWLFI